MEHDCNLPFDAYYPGDPKNPCGQGHLCLNNTCFCNPETTWPMYISVDSVVGTICLLPKDLILASWVVITILAIFNWVVTLALWFLKWSFPLKVSKKKGMSWNKRLRVIVCQTLPIGLAFVQLLDTDKSAFNNATFVFFLFLGIVAESMEVMFFMSKSLRQVEELYLRVTAMTLSSPIAEKPGYIVLGLRKSAKYGWVRLLLIFLPMVPPFCFWLNKYTPEGSMIYQSIWLKAAAALILFQAVTTSIDVYVLSRPMLKAFDKYIGQQSAIKETMKVRQKAQLNRMKRGRKKLLYFTTSALGFHFLAMWILAFCCVYDDHLLMVVQAVLLVFVVVRVFSNCKRLLAFWRTANEYVTIYSSFHESPNMEIRTET